MMGLGALGGVGGVVPGEGIEPTHLFRVADFKSAASTIPPSRPVVFWGWDAAGAGGVWGVGARGLRRFGGSWGFGALGAGLEATGGLEPPIEVLQTSALTTWLRRLAFWPRLVRFGGGVVGLPGLGFGAEGGI